MLSHIGRFKSFKQDVRILVTTINHHIIAIYKFTQHRWHCSLITKLIRTDSGSFTPFSWIRPQRNIYNTRACQHFSKVILLSAFLKSVCEALALALARLIWWGIQWILLYSVHVSMVLYYIWVCTLLQLEQPEYHVYSIQYILLAGWTPVFCALINYCIFTTKSKFWTLDSPVQ